MDEGPKTRVIKIIPKLGYTLGCQRKWIQLVQRGE